jgi:hypothetical protein
VQNGTSDAHSASFLLAEPPESTMKRAHLVCVASGLLGIPAFSGGCNSDALVVVENDGGSEAGASDARTTGNTDDAAIKENDGSATTNEAGAGVCVPNGITFQLTVGTTDDVWFGGPTPPWPPASFGCPGWLTLTAPGGPSPWGNSQSVSINVAKGCAPECPASRPEPAVAQSFTWDGTYYPVTKNSDPNSTCDTPACAPPGVYGVTMCVGYAGQDSGPSEGAPTCQSFSFPWPPATPSESTVATTITPTLGGG